MVLVGEYAMYFAESILHESSSKADLSKSAALKKLSEIRAALASSPQPEQEAPLTDFDAWWKRKTAWNPEGWTAHDRTVAKVAWDGALASSPQPKGTSPRKVDTISFRSIPNAR